MFKMPPTKIFVCYTVWQDIYDELSKDTNVECHKGVPTNEQLTEWGELEGHKIVVLDDLMMECSNSEEMIRLMTIFCHHYCLTTLYLTQNVYCQGRASRTVSLNAHYFVLMNNKRDTNQILTLGRQIFPGQSKFFLDSYKKAVSSPFGYLLVDVHPRTDKRYQLRTNILVGQSTIVYEPEK